MLYFVCVVNVVKKTSARPKHKRVQTIRQGPRLVRKNTGRCQVIPMPPPEQRWITRFEH